MKALILYTALVVSVYFLSSMLIFDTNIPNNYVYLFYFVSFSGILALCFKWLILSRGIPLYFSIVSFFVLIITTVIPLYVFGLSQKEFYGIGLIVSFPITVFLIFAEKSFAGEYLDRHLKDANTFTNPLLTLVLAALAWFCLNEFKIGRDVRSALADFAFFSVVGIALAIISTVAWSKLRLSR